MCVQPAFVIGTNNEDVTYNFAPITWVSITSEKDDDYLLIISMVGTKKTKQNVIRTGILSVNLVSTDMLELMDYFGTHHAKDGKKDGISYSVCRGEVVDVPVLEASRWVYECEVAMGLRSPPVTAITLALSNWSWGPIMVHSSTASPWLLPARILARAADRGSITPDTDTPNCW